MRLSTLQLVGQQSSIITVLFEREALTSNQIAASAMVPRLVSFQSQVCRLPRGLIRNQISPIAISRITALHLQRANMVRKALFAA